MLVTRVSNAHLWKTEHMKLRLLRARLLKGGWSTRLSLFLLDLAGRHPVVAHSPH